MSLFKLGASQASPPHPPVASTHPLAVSPLGDPSQKAGAPQHSSEAVSTAIDHNRTAEITQADSLLAELDGTRARVRPVEPREQRVSESRTAERGDAPAPAGVDTSTALVAFGGKVPDGCYIAAWSDTGKPVLRDKQTGKLIKGSGALPGAGKGRAPGLSKMVRDIVHIPGIITFLQDVAVGKLAAGTKMADRIKAAEILLDRGYGKPSQHVEIDDKTAQSETRREIEAMTTQKLASTVEQLRTLIARKDEIVTDAEIIED